MCTTLEPFRCRFYTNKRCRNCGGLSECRKNDTALVGANNEVEPLDGHPEVRSDLVNRAFFAPEEVPLDIQISQNRDHWEAGVQVAAIN